MYMYMNAYCIIMYVFTLEERYHCPHINSILSFFYIQYYAFFILKRKIKDYITVFVIF